MAKGGWSTMTPEERSAEMKRRVAKGKRNKEKSTKRKNSRSTRRASSNGRGSQEVSDKDHVSYLYGKVETIIEYYSHSNGLPFPTLASGVAALLRSKAGG
jgi:hypothetical protein